MDKSLGPDWNHWRKLGEVRIFEAVFLLLNQEPPKGPPEENDASERYAKTLRLLTSASHDRSQFSACALSISSPDLCSVMLEEVGAWAKASGLLVPDKFPRKAPQRLSAIAWPLWLNVPRVELWEGVALVLGIEPTTLKLSPQAWMAGPGTGPIFVLESFPNIASREDFYKALMFAEKATNHSGPIHLNTGLAAGMNKRTAQVLLSEVVAFFVSCKWEEIPSELLVPANTTGHARELAEPFNDGAAGSEATKKQDWKTLAWDYTVATLASGRHPTAKALNIALLACVDAADSPFEAGIGPNRGSLVLRKTRKKLGLKTIQNNWQELRRSAGLL